MLRILMATLLITAPVAAQAAFTADTPVEKIAANPDAAAVLNKDLPGLLTDSQFGLFKSMSLNQLQRASDGELSENDVNKAVADLQALPAHQDAPAPTAPAATTAATPTAAPADLQAAPAH